MQITESFAGKTLVITGGTGSSGATGAAVGAGSHGGVVQTLQYALATTAATS